MGECSSRRTDASEAIDVTFVIVSWNVRDLLRQCIDSILRAQDGLRVQIVVVDNASTDGTSQMVREVFPDVELVASERNLGFASGNNVGLRRARGRYVFFLNPDTLVQEDTVGRLASFLDRHPERDLIGPRLTSPDGSVQGVCARRLPTLLQVLVDALYLHQVPLFGSRAVRRLITPYDLEENQAVEAISGAAMFIRRKVAEELNGFDERYLHTGEDMDLCLRLQRRSSTPFYVADAVVVHLSGQSSAQAVVRTGTMSVLSMERYFERSHGRLQARAYRLIMQFLHTPLLIVVGLGKALLRKPGREELGWRWAFARGVWRWRVEE
jgi:GT2 family glycosyltransferase